MPQSDEQVVDFLRRYCAACSAYNDFQTAAALAPFKAEVQALDAETQARLLVRVFHMLGDLVDLIEPGRNRRWELMNLRSRTPFASGLVTLAAALLRRKLPLTQADLKAMLADTVRLELVSTWGMPHAPTFVRVLEAHREELVGDESTRTLLAQFAANTRKVSNATETKLAARIELLLGEGSEVPVDPGEAWTDAVLADLGRMRPGPRAAWVGLIQHCRLASGGKPTAKWSKAAKPLLRKLGARAFEQRIVRWLPLVDRPRTRPAPHTDWRAADVAELLILEHHADILKGLCWVIGTLPQRNLARTLGALAVSCYRKVPGIGPRAVKVGNAAICALGQMPGRDSLAQLAMLRVRVKFIPAQRLLEQALDVAAQREGLPREEIEELGVPSYGLTAVGELRETLGTHTALLTIVGTASTELRWMGATGKLSKSIPAAASREHGKEVKDLRAVAKDIQKMLPAQRDRIDSLFLERKSWPLSIWRERYLDHPLVGTLARRLIWVFRDGQTEVAAAWCAADPDGPPHGPGSLIRADGTPFEPSGSATTVTLWHAIDAESPPGSTATRDDVMAWRAFYEERHIRQPFKQAHREIYLLTGAERQTGVYSNRFAAHVLRQHQFHALCAQRAWKNRLRLMVDDEYPPAHRILRAWGLRAEFWIEGIGDDWTPEYVLDSGAYRFLTTDQVRFYRLTAAENRAHAGGGRYATCGPDEQENHPLPLAEVPPLVLSEVLRDVDLFVGVASVGNNPQWQDGGPDGVFRDYWHRYSFGDLSATAQTRRELLQRLIPRLSIASACSLTDRYLVVLGKRRTYKIHLGSGNILMAPNDEYLCIVPKSSTRPEPRDGKLFLPFEGDQVLAVILSKAFLLADDDKITDPTITQQIARTR